MCHSTQRLWVIQNYVLYESQTLGSLVNTETEKIKKFFFKNLFYWLVTVRSNYKALYIGVNCDLMKITLELNLESVWSSSFLNSWWPWCLLSLFLMCFVFEINRFTSFELFIFIFYCFCNFFWFYESTLTI